jgi:hypothetical protein
MTIDEELRRARFEMEHAEKGLMAKDFPIDQWILIKQYVGAALLADRIEMLKAMSVMSTGVACEVRSCLDNVEGSTK